MKVIKVISIILVALLIIGFIAGKAAGISLLALNAHDSIYTEDGLALKGYDVVALFNDQGAVEGSENFQTEWMDATWQFANEENLNAFQVNREKYIPAAGGHCAFAVGKGFAAPGDPQYAYKAENGNVYLFSNQEVMDDAMSTIDQVIRDTDINWEK
ncbi:hypothetical protein SAMN05421640_2129 [Ekhidna lutea]|uniref:YHS domain-containing protein n=1 Tax=Ekhidna lutea TaxID=447679 RepID=A0A239JFM1_EKHLU|nr:YHS domain-containing (seleno)protein [Ekhidna lutea]SNT04218.1 hypothetical protein SAMN05421640_2129 [Ekhidna lutea]